MKIKNITIIFFMLLAGLANIQSINTGIGANMGYVSNITPQTNLDPNSTVSSPDVQNSPISNWASSENSYWQEQMKNEQLTTFLGNISTGIDLSSPSIASKLSSTNTYTSNIAINIDLDKAFYKPGDQVNYEIQTTYNMSLISTQLYVNIYNSNNNFFYQYGGGYYQYNNKLPMISATITTDNNGFYHGSFSVPTSGQYSMFVSQNPINQNYYYGSNAYRVITVSDLAIYSRIPYYFIPSEPITGYSLILNGTNFQPIDSANVNISYYSFDWSTNTAHIVTSWVGLTNSAGEVQFSIPTDFSSDYWGYLVINASKNTFQSSLVRTIWSSYFYNQQSGIDFVPTLDKPIYQPGETLHARVLVWTNDYLNATKTPLINQPITIQLLNPQSVLLFQFQRITDEYGIITFDLPLDQSLTLGNYKLIFQKDNFQQIITVPIDYYVKPAFQVSINLDKQYVPNGQTATGSISAQYYFGKAVTNAQVNIYLKDLDGTIKRQVSGTTNNLGLFHLSIPVSATDTEPQLNLVASVTDPVGRIVITNTTIITVSNIYVGAWSSPYTPTPTDQVQISFYAYQGLSLNNIYYSYYSWQPIANQKVAIQIIGSNSVLMNTGTTVLSLEGVTNQYGFGVATFTLPYNIVLKYSNFYVKVNLDLKDGRSGSYTYSLQYAKYYTQITFDKSVYSPSDTVTATVKVLDLNNNSASAYVSISVFDSDYDLLYMGSSVISNKAYHLKLSQYAPSGDYIVYTMITYKTQGEWGYIYDQYVYGGQNTFKVGSSQTLNLTSAKDNYSSGETIKLDVSMNMVPQNPIYLEISKRGVVSLQSFLPSTNNFEIDLNNTDYLAPKITVLLLTVLPNGVILEVYKIITIEQKLLITITTNKQIYEPGEQATVTIKLFNSNNESVDGLSVISLIDSSVYGVQADPYWESSHFSNNDYWSIMATVTNWHGFQPIWFYYWYWFAYPIYYGPLYFQEGGPVRAPVYTNTVQSNSQNQNNVVNTNQINVRDNLPESMNWQPEVYIPKNGYTFNTTLPDTIGEWTVRVTATKGQTGVVEKATFNTFLPFFVEIDKPASAMQDDVVSIKGIIYNYLGQDINANVSIVVDNSIILNRETQSLRIPDNYLSSLSWSVYLPNFGSNNITIYAQTSINGKIISDAIRQPLVVIPNAVTQSSTNSGTITPSGTVFNITQYPESVQNNQYLVISKGINNVVLDSWQRLIGYPYGCLEQTMSKLMPDLLVLEYLKQNGNLTSALQSSIEQMIASGIARLLSMQKADGGFGWFGDGQSNVYMTSYAVYGINELMSYNYTSNVNALIKAVNYLIQNQNTDGHWSADYWYMDNLAFTAFTLRNLAQLNTSLTPGLSTAISKAINYLKSNWASNSDPYTAALYLLATYGTSKYDPTFGATVLNYLLNNQQISSNGGFFWSTDNNYWKPLGGTTETTALVLQALIMIDYSTYYSVISSGLKWLLQEQDPWGWSTTKGTAEALTALIQFANHSTYSNSGSVDIYVNGVNKTKVNINDNSGTYPIDMSNYLSVGNNIVNLTSSTGSSFIYYFSSVQMLRTNPIIEFENQINIKPNTNFSIPFNLILNSKNVILKDVKITLMTDTWKNMSSLTFYEPIIADNLTGNFDLQSGNKLGQQSIKGIQIEYTLSSSDFSSQSLGKIKEIFGPINIIVSQSSTNSLPKTQSNLPNNSGLKSINSYSITTPVSINTQGLQIQKSLSQSQNIKFGDYISVTLTLQATKTISDQYLFIQDTIPSGFTLDKQSIANNAGLTSYSLTGSSLDLFISSISPTSPISITYRIQATTNILASISPSAMVSSMYNDSNKIYSNSIVIGSNFITKASNGAILKDLIIPNILKFTYSVQNKQISYNLQVNDSEGIGSAKMFLKDTSWQSLDLQSTNGNQFIGSVKVQNGGYIKFYIQIQDTNGNNFESEIYSIYVPIVVLEVGLIIGVLFLTGIISTSGYYVSKHKLLKRNKE